LDRGVKPHVVELRIEDDGHALVQGLHQRVGRSRDDHAGRDGLGVAFPALPQTREGEGGFVLQLDVVRLLAPGQLLPLEEAVSGDEAAALAESALERGLFGQGFGAGVDEAGAWVLAPGGDQAPAQRHGHATVALQAHVEHVLAGRDVEARRQPGHEVERETARQALGGDREGESSAHGGSVARG